MRLLVVEDEFIIAEVIMDELASAGFHECEHRDSIAAALTAAQSGDWAGALLDISLRGVAVFPVAQALLDRAIPFIFCSGGIEATSLPVQFRGAPVLRKPWSPGELQALAKGVFCPAPSGA